MDHSGAMEKQTPPDKSVKIAELKRELKQREKVFPRLIKAKKLSRDRANRQYWILKCILEDYLGNDANVKGIVSWQCPVCAQRNGSMAGEELVYCESEQGCKTGPFYLRQDPARRAMKTEVVYTAHRIEGMAYDYQQQGNLL